MTNAIARHKRLVVSSLLLLGSGALRSQTAIKLMPATQVCGTAIPKSLASYLRQVRGKYPVILCDVSGIPDSVRVVNGQAIMSFKDKSQQADPTIVSHEMMHLWLGTKGWRIGLNQAKPFPLPMGVVGQQAGIFYATAQALETYMQHRMFMRLLHQAGLNDHKEVGAELVQDEHKETQSGIMFSPAQTGAVYLQMKLADPSVAAQYAAHLREKGWGKSLEAASLYEAQIAKNNPQSQDAALKTTQDCLNEVFRYGSPYLEPMN